MAYTRTGYATQAAFPATGTVNIIYVDLSNGNEFLWSGTAYIAYVGTLAGIRQGYQDLAWFNANPGFLLGRGQRVNLLQTGQYKLGDGVTALGALAFLGGATSTPTIQQVLTAGQVATTTIETTGFIVTGGASTGFLKADGSVDSSPYITAASLIPYLLSATAATTYQPLDADLTAIAALTTDAFGRGLLPLTTGSAVRTYIGAGTGNGDALTTNPLSQFAATTSLQLKGVISDETGSGALVFGTSPTFTTDITTPLINPSTFLNIGNAAVAGGVLSKMRVGLGTSFIDFGERSNGLAAIWLNQASPGTTNYTIRGAASQETEINAASNISFQFGGTTRHSLRNNYIQFIPAATSGGLQETFDFRAPTHLAQTAGANASVLKLTGAVKQFATGSQAALYFSHLTMNTVSYVGASTCSLLASLAVEYSQGGTNSSVTTSAAIYVPTLALTNTTNGVGIYVVAPTGGSSTNLALRADGSNQFGVSSGSNTHNFFNTSGVTFSSIRPLVGSATYSALYLGLGTALATNYVLASNDASTVYLNGATMVNFHIADVMQMSVTSSLMTFAGGFNIALNAGTGTKIGTATTQKLSFWNKTAIIQPTTAITGAALVSNGGTTITSTDTFGGYTLQQLAAILINTGLAA